ncbi:MAG: histidine phosphatase family protein [Turneriella sp.]|nr:histidine phosphatase family protein [Turneriella sp.]
MTELVLIRHGQANSAGENYDELTETGREQARKVGAWLATSGYTFDQVLHGGLKRQTETLELILGKMPKTAPVFSEAEIHPALAEFDLKIFYTLAAEMRHGNAEFAEVLKAWNKARHSDSQDKGDIFKRLMGLVIGEWTRRGENFTAAESFPAFQKRVLSVFELASAVPQRILAVTSGGPISLIIGATLRLDTAGSLGLIRRIYNTSLHHLALKDDRRDLVCFNAVPHLALGERTLV